MHDENLREKRCICVYDDNYSIFEFISEKPYTSNAFVVLCHHLKHEKENRLVFLLVY